jgi:hypothetical protein
MEVTRQQRRYQERCAAKDAARKPQGKHIRPFWRAMEWADRAAKLVKMHAGSPLTLQAALAALPPYKSRGKGRGSRPVFAGHKPGKYTPHQGPRECERRMIGGFWTLAA